MRAASIFTCALFLFAAAGAEELTVIVGSYSVEDKADIHIFGLNRTTGELVLRGAAADGHNPSFLAYNGRRLYVVHEEADYAGQRQGSVASFECDLYRGTIRKLDEQPSLGAHPCHLSIDPAGAFLSVANYSGGNVVLIPLSDDGSLLPPADMVQHEGKGTDLRRQEGPHAHSVTFSPDGRFVLAADLGIDKVMIYRFDRAANKLLPNDPPFAVAAPGAGPRHLTFDRSGRRVYVVNELNSTVTAYAFDAARGSLTEIETVSTLPRDFRGSNTAADIHLTPNCRFLYASNRGHDSIAAFRVHRRSGRLVPLGCFAAGGKTPRNFAVDPKGRLLIVAAQNSDVLTVFRIGRNGALTPISSTAVPRPVCVLILPQ